MGISVLKLLVLICHSVFLFAQQDHQISTDVWTKHAHNVKYFNSTRENRRFFFGTANRNDEDLDPSCGSGSERGTCMSSNACKGGTRVTATGNNGCPNGGTCCRFTAQCPTNLMNPCIIRQSGTVIVNENSNSAYLRTYRFQRPKKGRFCQLRLDFDTLTLSPPNVAGDCNRDSLMAPGLNICGFNNGQHAYFTFDEDTNRVDVRINIQNTNSRYTIRATYIRCDSRLLAPRDCLQYYTEPSGTIRSFGFGTQSNNLDYTICILRAEGMNQIRYSECDPAGQVPGQMNPVDSFFVSGAWNGIGLSTGQPCTTDWVQVNGLFRYCGSNFQTVTTAARPFWLHVHFDQIEGPGVPLPPEPCPANTVVQDPALGGAWTCGPVGAPAVCQCVWAPSVPGGRNPDFDNTGFCFMYMELP